MLDNLITPASEQVLKVTELTRQIKAQLEGRFTQIWVQGEVSNLRRQSSGHVYFSLKDAGSQLPCVLFARDAAQQGFQLEDGMEVLLFGSLSVYAPHGRYQLIAKMTVQSGQGRLQMEFERLKKKLAAEGLFEKSLKKPLPALPMRIAVVTSPTGAAVRDFLRILHRRNYKGEVVIFPARVQGKGSEKEIATMLEYAGASKDFDLVVITRGGGSIEDLWAFNEEVLARAVVACPIPVISAVGHEIDIVLTDYVADKRAETPSAAAELISSLMIESEQRLEQAESNLRYWIETGIAERRQSLDALQAKMHIIAPARQVEMLGMQLDDLENRLSQSLQTRLTRERTMLAQQSQRLAEHHPRIKISLARQALENLDRRLSRASKVDMHTKREHLLHLQKRLENGSLNATLKRGFAILQTTDGAIISSAESGKAEDQLTARLNDGDLTLKVLK
ncbi:MULTISPECIES: exodeoxyribonuclease VII large subunit [unclassified Lentimonas]|uniref:exodeoxyribonuclease VII large subunit n=1 Tax=unclassified Lentimonas TaxID=2630993 RepID=UPI001328CA3A|nr:MULTISPECIES: exodeoxyribonuclease VII large subunit [unclassified Lentimonas]CAA6692850.1 Exodeoxyribonuclease VII large subunit (EC [Lentimonas sp. CC19]CAA6695006.1 Exodeoxyribonuclease VII large subunit (EC [Lentimonas sp. CC10]CAA7069621.1 Exodeoxyribonuclease VII large subunit (EC [Lentimonas sp. CC11]